MEHRRSKNWLNELSKKLEYIPAVIGSNYQPLATCWSVQNTSCLLAEREYHRGVYIIKYGVPVFIVAGGWCRRRGARCNDLFECSSFATEYSEVRRDCEWSARLHFSMLATRAGEAMYIVGGDDGLVKSDVWVSRNYGTSFSCQTPQAPWGPRVDFASALLGESILVICGGNSVDFFRDVWISEDGGKRWDCVQSKSPWRKRGGSSLIVWKDEELLLIGGYNEVGAMDDVWSSVDCGKSWSRKAARTPWKPRHSFNLICDSVTMELLILGGTGSEGQKFNDAWASLDGGVTWIPRRTVANYYQPPVIYGTEEGSVICVGNRMRAVSESDLSFVKKDCVILLHVGRRIQKIPREVWIGDVLAFAVDVRQLWKRSNADWNRL